MMAAVQTATPPRAILRRRVGSSGRRLCLSRSLALKTRAEQRIPSCSQTLSKSPSQFVQGAAPVFLARGRGSRVWDVDGNEFIDYPMALGAVILGHAHPGVMRAVSAQLREGTIFSLPHPLEVKLAERIAAHVPGAEMVRFAKNGSDATTGAVRLARAVTGRQVIACCGYHGSHDWYLGTTNWRAGVPSAVQALTVPFAYNDVDSLERVFAAHPGNVAAVIMEPVGVELPRPGFLEGVRALTQRHGAVLVFDEIVTGFRLGLGGAQERFGVVPDLTCLGKAMANGYPLSALAGRAELMRRLEEDVFFSFTFGGETLSLAAAVATLDVLARPGTLERIWRHGARLQEGYNRLARELRLAQVTECVGLPPRTVVMFRDAQGGESLLMKSVFQQEVIKRGVLFNGVHLVSAAHRQADIDQTLRAYREALAVLGQALAEDRLQAILEGPPVSAVFRPVT